MTQADITFDTDVRSTLRLMDQIDVLTMGTSDRRRFLASIGREVRKDLRGNIRGQKTVTGEAMKKRSNKKKRRMLSKMGKGMVTKIQNNHEAVVTWKRSSQAKLAYQHHHGISEDYTAKKAARINGIPDYKKPATPAQAKALNKEGYRRKVARKRGKGGAILKRVPQKWIRENMTLGQAGFILRLMRTGTSKGKQSWKIPLPKRAILGASAKDADIYLVKMAEEALTRIKQV